MTALNADFSGRCYIIPTASEVSESGAGALPAGHRASDSAESTYSNLQSSEI
jgi:hypothetical protein